MTTNFKETSKKQNRFHKLKTLPNTHKGTAAAISKFVSIIPLVIVLLILLFFNIQFPMPVFIPVYLGILAVESYLFAKWIEYAKKL